jgi:hypothetical protein
MHTEGADTIAPLDEMSLELDYRAADGIEVALFWSKLTNRLWVAVTDTRTGDSFELDVESDTALDVFHHPYAYAVTRGVRYLEPVRG